VKWCHQCEHHVEHETELVCACRLELAAHDEVQGCDVDAECGLDREYLARFGQPKLFALSTVNSCTMGTKSTNIAGGRCWEASSSCQGLGERLQAGELPLTRPSVHNDALGGTLCVPPITRTRCPVGRGIDKPSPTCYDGYMVTTQQTWLWGGVVTWTNEAVTMAASSR